MVYLVEEVMDREVFLGAHVFFDFWKQVSCDEFGLKFKELAVDSLLAYLLSISIVEDHPAHEVTLV